MTACCFMISNSSRVSGPGLSNTLSGIPTLPMSCNGLVRYKSCENSLSSSLRYLGVWTTYRASTRQYSRIRSKCAPVSGSRASASLARLKITRSRLSRDRIRSATRSRTSNSSGSTGLERNSSAPVQTLHTILRPCLGGEQNEVGIPAGEPPANFPAEIDAIDPGHLPVGHDHRKLTLANDLQSFAAIAGRGYVVAKISHRVFQQRQRISIIFNN